MFKAAGLDFHNPDDPVTNSIDAVQRLFKAAGSFVTRGQPAFNLSECVVLVPSTEGNGRTINEIADCNLRNLTSSVDRRRFLLLIGELGRYINPIKDGQKATKLFIRGLESSTGWHVALTDEVQKSLLRSFSRALSLKGRKDVRLFIVAKVKPEPSKRTLWCEIGALFATTKRFQKVESSYEADFFRSLIEDGRAFLRPLAVDDSQGRLNPDCVLLDCGARPFIYEIDAFFKQPHLLRYSENGQRYNIHLGTDGWGCLIVSPTLTLQTPIPPRIDGCIAYDRDAVLDLIGRHALDSAPLYPVTPFPPDGDFPF